MQHSSPGQVQVLQSSPQHRASLRLFSFFESLALMLQLQQMAANRLHSPSHPVQDMQHLGADTEGPKFPLSTLCSVPSCRKTQSCISSLVGCPGELPGIISHPPLPPLFPERKLWILGPPKIHKHLWLNSLLYLTFYHSSVWYLMNDLFFGTCVFSVQGSRGDQGKQGAQGKDGLKVKSLNFKACNKESFGFLWRSAESSNFISFFNLIISDVSCS